MFKGPLQDDSVPCEVKHCVWNVILGFVSDRNYILTAWTTNTEFYFTFKQFVQVCFFFCWFLLALFFLFIYEDIWQTLIKSWQMFPDEKASQCHRKLPVSNSKGVKTWFKLHWGFFGMINWQLMKCYAYHENICDFFYVTLMSMKLHYLAVYSSIKVFWGDQSSSPLNPFTTLNNTASLK